MGDGLHEGIIGANPIYGSGNTETCTWCEYKDVCLKDNPKYRYAEKLSHEECLRKLGGDDDGENMD